MSRGRQFAGPYSGLFAWIVAGFLISFASTTCAGAQNLVDNFRRNMVAPIHVFVVYWLPTGVSLDPSIPDGTGNFRSLISRYFSDASGNAFFHVLNQYPGTTCRGATCFASNTSDAVVPGGAWTDAQAYPHPGTANNAGTRANPLQDADIQGEIARAIDQNGWNIDANSIVFVVTGVTATSTLVEECNGGVNCTFNQFCAYHKTFPHNGITIIYSYLSDASFNTAGCNEGLSTTGTTGPNGQIATDREIALATHEFYEAITDPDLDTWLDTAGNEIGDKCNQQPSIVDLRGHGYAVQQEWSNASSSCVGHLFDLAPIYHLLLN